MALFSNSQILDLIVQVTFSYRIPVVIQLVLPPIIVRADVEFSLFMNGFYLSLGKVFILRETIVSEYQLVMFLHGCAIFGFLN